MSLTALQEIQSAKVSQGTVLTIGTFDGVHRGHQAIISAVIDRAKKDAYLAGCITFKASPRETLRPQQSFRYLMSLEQTCFLVHWLPCSLLLLKMDCCIVLLGQVGFVYSFFVPLL